MTRINTIPPQELCDKHLIAEIREITRIPNTIKSGKARVVITEIPDLFRLGSGHVKFFYDKLKFLDKRYSLLYNECLYRGFNVQDNRDSFTDLPINLLNDWEPTLESMRLIRERIDEKKLSMKSIKYTNR